MQADRIAGPTRKQCEKKTAKREQQDRRCANTREEGGGCQEAPGERRLGIVGPKTGTEG